LLKRALAAILDTGTCDIAKIIPIAGLQGIYLHGWQVEETTVVG
jgi:hypothetical protein